MIKIEISKRPVKSVYEVKKLSWHSYFSNEERGHDCRKNVSVFN